MTAHRVRERRPRSRSREPWVHLVAGLLGPAAGVLLLGTLVPSLVLRTAALAVALTLVAAGLVRAVALGRAELRQERPGAGVYAGVVGRFVAAFLLVVMATS